MTDGERLDALHTKMEDRRRKKERRLTFAAGAGCAVSAAGLGFLIIDGTAHTSGTAGTYSGAAMLFDGSGIYVLIAVIAFSARRGSLISGREAEKHDGRPVVP